MTQQQSSAGWGSANDKKNNTNSSGWGSTQDRYVYFFVCLKIMSNS